MSRKPEDGLRRLLSGAIPFPETGRVFLMDTGLAFLAGEVEDAVGSDRLVITERHLGRAANFEGRTVLHSARPEPNAGDMVILAVGRERLRLFQDLQFLAGRLGPTGRIVIFGARRDGMIPAEDLLRSRCHEKLSLQRGGARLLLVAPLEDSGDWNLEAPPDRFVVEARQTSVKVCARPGVFSWNRLDGGSAFLLEAIQVREGDRLLDLGCGNGLLAAVLLAEGIIAGATLTDADALALEAAKETLRMNGLTAEVIAGNAGENLPRKAFTLVACNPSYHLGGNQERGTGLKMIEQAARVLDARGRLVIVAPRFHDHRPQLDRYFRASAILQENASYRIWQGTRPRRKPVK